MLGAHVEMSNSPSGPKVSTRATKGPSAYDKVVQNIEKLRQLRIEHRDLDDVIARLSMDIHVDEIQLKRLKKRKLMLKDQIERYGSHLIPDLNA